jgi:EpsI family protein
MNRRIITLSVVLLLSFGARAWLSAAPRIAQHEPLSRFPTELGPYAMRSSQTITEEVQRVLHADDYLVRTYTTADGKRADLFIAYYKAQEAGESMHSPKNCLPGSGWEPVLNDRITINAPGGPVEVNRYVVEKGSQRSLILYWYHSGRRVYASEIWGKAYLIADSARTGRRDGAIARVVVPMRRDENIKQITDDAAEIAALMQRDISKFVGAN